MTDYNYNGEDIVLPDVPVEDSNGDTIWFAPRDIYDIQKLVWWLAGLNNRPSEVGPQTPDGGYYSISQFSDPQELLDLMQEEGLTTIRVWWD